MHFRITTLAVHIVNIIVSIHQNLTQCHRYMKETKGSVCWTQNGNKMGTLYSPFSIDKIVSIPFINMEILS